MYYFHPSYIEMEKVGFGEFVSRSKYCDRQQCVPDFPYYEENGRIEDHQVNKEYIDSTQILEIKDYEKDLGQDFVNSTIKE